MREVHDVENPPHQREAERLLGRTLLTRTHYLEAAEQIRKMGPEAVALAARMSEAWISFATRGDPKSKKSGLPPWPAYDSERRATMLFNNESKVVNDPAGDERKVMDGILNPA